MANRYSTPAKSSFMNYVEDVPFQELYSLGATMAGRADQAQKEMQDYLKLHSEFSSLSAKDNKAYYDETLGRMKSVVDNLAQDPDRIKTVEGRRMVQNAINGADFAKIANLKASAKGLEQYKKNVDDMKAKGLYNEAWDDYADLANYSTSDSGVFAETNVTPFMSTAQMAEPTMKELKDGYLEKESNRVYDVYGISQDGVWDASVSAATDIASTPTGKRHIQDAIRNGETTPEKAMDWLTNKVYQENAHRARISKKIVNDLYKADYEHSLRMRLERAKQDAKDKPSAEQYSGKAAIVAEFSNKIRSGIANTKVNFNDNKDAGVSAMNEILDSDLVALSVSEKARLRDSANIGDFVNKLTYLHQADNTKMPAEVAAKLVEAYNGASFRASMPDATKGGNLFSGVTVDVAIDDIYQYQGVDTNSKLTASKSLTMTPKDGETRTYVPVSSGSIRDSVIMDANGLISGKNDKYTIDPTASGRGMDLTSSPLFSTSSGFKKSMGDATSAVDWDKDIMKKLLTYSKEAYVSYDGTTTSVSDGNNNYYYARGTVAIPRKTVEKFFDETIESNGIKGVDGKKMREYLSGDYSENKSNRIMTTAKTSYFKGGSDVEQSDGYVFIDIAAPFLDSDHRVAKVDLANNKKVLPSDSQKASVGMALDTAYGTAPAAIANNTNNNFR